MRILRLLLVLLPLGAAACGASTVVNQVDEKEANRIIVLLDDYGITASKTMVDTGRSVHFMIGVPANKRVEAMRLLDRHEYPRRKASGYSEVFKEGGLIPTSAEEGAKKISAIEGEIENQLMLHSHILDAKVNIVMPEESALRTTDELVPPTTASVAVKYLPLVKPDGKEEKPIYEQTIQAMVSNSVEKLAKDKVIVMMNPAQGSIAGGPVTVGGKGTGPLAKFPAKTQQMIIVGVVGVLLILGLAVVLSQMQLRSVRGRHRRLQTEVAKIRRKD